MDAISDIWDQACENNSKDTNAKSPKFIRLEAKTDLWAPFFGDISHNFKVQSSSLKLGDALSLRLVISWGKPCQTKCTDH